ncbi:MAG: hypothetical protein KF760_35195 [Candidatus Eremiobacteraeota bacterium]|nr:hypothetical protein [Candidatus Eremiobacteraeota bacterium]MCW5870210.1 hypothetical protein [Candidatus Eremiobacteraeota bacterium]
MASSIGGNFNVPGNKQIQPNRHTGAKPAQNEVAAPGDQVQLSGPQAPAVEKQTRSLQADPASVPTGGFEIAIRSEKPGVQNSPDRLLMSGVQEIGGYTPPADGSGVTGLNSINSVVSSGMFQGLNGQYGQRSLFGA